jgi:plastocyanin
MRKLLRSAAAAAALVAVATLVAAAPAATATTNVAITHSGFVLKAITIQQGDSVMWTNSDTSSHQVVSQSAGFASPVLKPGDTFTYVFTKAGKFGYTDAFNKTFDGTVTVAPAGSVTLDNSTGLVTYGGRVVLSGTVSSNQAGEPVNVLQTQCGKTAQSAERIASATTTTGGAYSASVQPTMRTTYVAMWKSSTSPSVAVSVRPRVHLGRVSLRRFSVRVDAGSSLAGHSSLSSAGAVRFSSGCACGMRGSSRTRAASTRRSSRR